MKKILLAIVLTMSGFALYGQEKGDMYVSGVFSSVGGSRSDMNFSQSGNLPPTHWEQKIRTTPVLTFAPEFGYFIADRCVLRAGVSYGFERVKTITVSDGVTSDSCEYTHLFSVDAGVSYYVRICNKFYYRPGICLFAGAVREVEIEDGSMAVSRWLPCRFGVSFEPAMFEYKPSRHFGMMIRLGSCDLNITRLNTSLDMSLWAVALGFQYYF